MNGYVLPVIFTLGVALCCLFVPAMLLSLWEVEYRERWEEWWAHHRSRWWRRDGR